MKHMRLASVLLALLVATAAAQQKHPITFEEMFTMGRVADPQVSPDGQWVAFVVTEYDIDANRGNSDLWLVAIDGSEARRLTSNAAADFSPRWSPDGRQLAFVSTRSGKAQIWLLPLDGGEARQLTTTSTGASGPVWSADGKWILFTSRVYPDCESDDCNRRRDQERAESKVKARVIDQLLFRHWNSWRDGKWSHLFVVSASEGGPGRDLIRGRLDVPPIALGGAQDYVFSPDGKNVTYVANTDPMVAISTNNDLFTIPVEGGSPRKLTSNPANDNYPQYSPDGRFIAYRAQLRAGFESDRYRLMIYDRRTGRVTNLTENLDRSIGSYTWSPDGKAIYFTAVDQGYSSIHRLDVASHRVSRLTEKSYNANVAVTPDGKTLIFRRQSMRQPFEIYRADVNGRKVRALTHVNDARLADIDMNAPEEVWYEGAGGTKVHGFLLKPPAFDPAKKYPLVLLVHGGPQGMWADGFHFRWNAQMFAAPGYVVFMPNPRGSTGYGQKFTDEISRDWGGKAYEDIMRGVDYVLAHYPFVDSTRMVAAGASYGGYMMDWILGHTDRFRAIVSHDGVFNTVSMYFSTEELWFPEWEFGGTPWTNKALYEKWSPHNYVANFKTPTLVIHSQNDFRVPLEQGLSLFTALQRMKVPSRLLYFPDEDHFVTKPQNARLWWKTIYEWFDRWLGTEANGGE